MHANILYTVIITSFVKPIFSKSILIKKLFKAKNKGLNSRYLIFYRYLR